MNRKYHALQHAETNILSSVHRLVEKMIDQIMSQINQ